MKTLSHILTLALVLGILCMSFAAADTFNDGTHDISTDMADYPVPVTEYALGLQESEPVDVHFFDNAVFIGDSITLKLYYYIVDQRKAGQLRLGNAKFLTAGSLGSGNALWEVSDDSVHPTYQGQKLLLQDAVKLIGAKKVYLMLGMNDVSIYGTQGSVDNMVKLVNLILEQSPDAEIYIESATPRISRMTKNPTNAALFEYDILLCKACMENGWNFIDVASVMRDENGYLFDDYCSDPQDMGMHFSDIGCEAWINYLLTHTKEAE